ncbi:superoxide dismutase [Cu-Zn] 2-like [Maniola jurtina]|uniref:superoxide dismutase [Cu-Zn] 2-like n=1 Tax=Maniola jurtina TaxID=191418 RepID=UPI001E687661|nr:superoxide dismutase [Cu-Zn] 2-like [Maniola jurtina]XP_045785709.1 superoxide dismutase [Cu-Zn] 2-like [Maniola jurtina]
MMYQLLFLASAALLVAGHGGHDHSHIASTSKEGATLRAVARLASPDGHDIHGNVTFTQEGDTVHILGHIYGMPKGLYGFHVHESGDITGGCLSTGAHFNPENKLHGHPEDAERHVGDLGNIEFDNDSLSHIDFYDKVIALYGPHSILGRAVVLHAMADDFGRSDHPDSRKTGNAGGRVACGVIGIQSPVYGWDRNAASSSKYWITSIMFVVLSVTTMLLQ